MEYVTLNNGVQMPMLGYGVYQVDPAECERCVSDAIAVGYRSIDTAQAYANEEGVGAAVRKSGVPREEFFLTSKVWITNAGYEKAKASIDESLKKLQTDYLDLMLIHQPFNDYYGTYRAMEDAYRAGKLRAIGVSNFYPDRFIDLYHFVDVKPAVNRSRRTLPAAAAGPRAPAKNTVSSTSPGGPFAEGREGPLPKPRPHRHRGKIRKERGPGGAAVPDPERCGGHSQVHPPGADGGEPFRL